jgi:glycosyltransferase involved in cell wall biosynthesis
MFEITIAVCTYRRPLMLEKCLDSLICQKIPEINYEILVIDNCPKENSRYIVRKILDEYPNHTIRYYMEPALGIAHARNRAIRESRGEWIAFIDDDEIAEESWLLNLKNGAVCYDENSYLFGGKIVLDFDLSQLPWLPPKFYGYFSHVDHGEDIKILNLHKEEYILTSNMFFKKAALKEIIFQEDLGHKGYMEGGGEDIRFVQDLDKIGMMQVYIPKAIVKHSMTLERLMPHRLLTRLFSTGAKQISLMRQEPRSFALYFKEQIYNFRIAVMFLIRGILCHLSNKEREKIYNYGNALLYLGRFVANINVKWAETLTALANVK